SQIVIDYNTSDQCKAEINKQDFINNNSIITFVGLIKYQQHKHYVDVCYDTVYTLQSIPLKYGKCIDNKTGKLHPPCIYALANTIKSCITKLNGLSENVAKYYCGYTLMKYCAVHVGLDHIPLKFDYKI
ncbi:unnamed protein product, partial [Rotaria magnacalcarata]